MRGQNVDVVLVDADLGVLPGHRLHALIPVRHGDGDAVGLGGRGQVARRAALRQIEGELEDAVHAGAAHDRFLDHDLALGAAVHAAADAGIFALGVLAHHVEIDRAGRARLAAAVDQRAADAGHQAYRTQVHVLVEAAPELQQRAPQRDMVGHRIGPADRAEKQGIVAAQGVEPAVGQHLAVTRVVVAAGEVEMVALQRKAEPARGGIQHAQPFGHDFLADPVSGNHGDAIRTHGMRSAWRLGWVAGPRPGAVRRERNGRASWMGLRAPGAWHPRRPAG